MTGPLRRGGSTLEPGPLRRGGAAAVDPGLNYAAIGATATADVVAFPPEGFRAAEYRHRIGSGARRFEVAGRALMTWGALRRAGFGVGEVHAEAGAGTPRLLEDGTPWITPGMTAVVTSGSDEPPEPVKVIRVIEGPGRVGYIYGSRPGHPDCMERLLLVEHGADDAVHVTLRSIWRVPGSRWSPASRAAATRQRRLDERVVRALHPTHAAV